VKRDVRGSSTLTPVKSTPPSSRVALATLLASLFVLGSCGGASTLDARHASVQNTMLTMGLVPAMPVSRLGLARDAEETLTVTLERGSCVTLVAIGEGSARDITLSVRDSEGDVLADESSHDTQASVQFCPSESGRFGVRVGAVGGSANVLVAAYRDEGRGGRTRGAVAVDAGCENATLLRPGERTTGNTAQGTHALDPSCAQGAGPEQIFYFELTEPARASISVESTFDAILSLRTGCMGGAELACNDDYGDAQHSRVEANLSPGTYYAVVDGFPGAMGEFSIELRLAEVKTEAEVCAAVTPLVPGQPVHADNSDGSHSFQATCANGASGPEHVRRLTLDAKSRVRISQQSDFDGALHMRGVCDRATSELACNDDYDSVNRSLITAVLDPGDYFVISDGFGADRPSSGSYSVLAEAAPANGTGSDADTCTSPGSITEGEPTRTDTFESVDDFQGSCGGAGAPDTVHRLDLSKRSRVRITTGHAQFDGVIYIRDRCDGGEEKACRPFPMAKNPAAYGSLDVVLERGSHYVVVDGQRPDAFGAVELDIASTDVAALERECNTSPLLVDGRTVSGSTEGRPDAFRASCAGDAQSGDMVYRIRLKKRSRVEVSLSSSYDAALHLRRSCLEDSSEIECNDDHGDNRHSKVEATLDPGTYFVVVDGFRTGNEGTYELSYTAREL
jgi:hypothetical protein